MANRERRLLLTTSLLSDGGGMGMKINGKSTKKTRMNYEDKGRDGDGHGEGCQRDEAGVRRWEQRGMAGDAGSS